MKKIKRRQDRREHAPGFVGCERATRKKLAEVFVGKFGDGVGARRTANHPGAKMKNPEQAGMREGRCGAPTFALKIGVERIFGNEFDGRIRGSVAGAPSIDGGE